MGDPGARGRGKDGSKAATNKTLATLQEQGEMDLAGFRIGKQRLVSKKKKKTNLKKVILEEREERRREDSPTRPAGVAGSGGRPASTAQPSCDVGAANANPVGADATLGEGSAANWPTAGALESASANGRQAAPVTVASRPSVFIPSWCQETPNKVPDESTNANATGPVPKTAVSAPSVFIPSWGQESPKKEHEEFANPSGRQTTTTAAASSPSVFIPSWCQESPKKEPEEAVAPAAAVAAQDGDWHGPYEADENLPVAEALARMRRLQEEGQRPQEKKPKPLARGNTIEVRHYVHQVLSDELDEKVKVVLGELSRFQERAKERDPLKFAKQKRFCVGMREACRAVARGKAKAIIAAPNMEECTAEGGLDENMEQLIEEARENDVPVVFALSRNRIGKALGKNIRLSIVCVLSAEGAHQELKAVVKLTDDLRRQWVLRQMAHITSEEAQEAQRRAAEKAARDAERRAAKAVQEGARREEEERQRLEARAAKLAEKARKAAEREKEAERRRQLKAEKAERERAAKEAEAGAEGSRREAEKRSEEERRQAMAAQATEQAARARKDAERRALEERQRAAEQAARRAGKTAAGGAGDASESDSDHSSVLLGFNAELF